MLGFASCRLLMLLLVISFCFVADFLDVQQAQGTATRLSNCISRSSSSAGVSRGRTENGVAADNPWEKSEILSPRAEKKISLRAELIHKDKLSGSTASTFERLHDAVTQSHARAKRLGRISRAFASKSHKQAASRVLYDFTTPLASDQGSYLMQLKLGTPSVLFHVIADTGSDLVWVQCRPCDRCYSSTDPKFDPSKSSSYSQLSCSDPSCSDLEDNQACTGSTCGYYYSYGDSSSTSGSYSSETLTMITTSGKPLLVSPLNFGCGFDNQGTFGNTSGGLAGLGRGPISLVSQLSSVIEEQFSYCLVDFAASSTITSPLLFGSAASLSGPGISSTSILDGQVPTFYYVSITGIAVGGRSLNIPGGSFGPLSGGTIFDSGTTLTYLESQAYSIVRKAFASKISLPIVSGSQYGLDLCYKASSNSNFQPPTLTINLGGATISPPPQNYFLLADTNVLCLAIMDSGGLGIPSIIGNVLQQNYLVSYDLTHSKISFKPASCESL